MLHACVVKFDVMRNLKKFIKFFGTKQDLNNLLDWIPNEAKLAMRPRGRVQGQGHVGPFPC